MKLAIFLFFTMTLFGCSKPMSNDEIASASKLCRDNDLRPNAIWNLFYTDIVKVVCVP